MSDLFKTKFFFSIISIMTFAIVGRIGNQNNKNYYLWCFYISLLFIRKVKARYYELAGNVIIFRHHMRSQIYLSSFTYESVTPVVLASQFSLYSFIFILMQFRVSAR